MNTIAKQLKPRQPKYKSVKMIAAFCPICKKRLQGNDSVVLPYECDCGIWVSDWLNPGFYHIRIEAR